MFLKSYPLKFKGKRNNMSDSSERLFDEDVVMDPEEELDEQMHKLSLTSKQPELKQNIDDKKSVKDMLSSTNLANNHETPIVPEYADYFQHDPSSHDQWNRYQGGVRQRFLNRSMVHIREMFSRLQGPQSPQSHSVGDFNHNFSFEPYQQGLSMQCHPAEPENLKSSINRSFKKSRRNFIRNRYCFFKGRLSRDCTHESALLLPKEN